MSKRRPSRRRSELARGALATGLMNEPIDVDVNAAKTVANVSIPVEGNGTDSTSNAALAALRNDVIPSTVGSVQEPRSPSRAPRPSRRTSTTR